nr:hypothetical protein [Rhodococcus sp. (in: high G+C Gram-positive bacteria)]
MQVRTDSRNASNPLLVGREAHTVHVEHGIARELLLIALVVALGVLATAAIVLPALVSH